jgi:molecular chaperone GrpE (heat shock protein)
MTQTTQNEEILENDSATVTDATEEEVAAEASDIPPADTNDAEKIKKLTDALARATADYQNLLKRSESERREMAAFFTESFVKKILPTLDNLDRVVSGTPAELQN